MPAVSAQLNDFIMPAASASERKPSARTSWFTRFADAVVSAHARRTDAEIGRLIESQGGRFTDSLEREIERRFV